MRTLIRVVSILFLLQGLLGQSLSKDKPDVYSRVRIFAKTPDDIQTLQQRGIDIEHYQGKVGEYIEVEINRYELDQVRASGIPYAVTVANMDDYYARRPAATSAELEVSKAILRQNGITSFTYGSMGGFYTYAQVVQKLDSMRMQYPNLITAKESIGVSWEGRTIWAVEISDNPGVAEPGEAVVYFDGLHHAREPEGMECLMYYMSWLLDNYGTDPEATYLVNNRRIVFVPITNPDGYVYNQSTNPNGGGDWRKNRHNYGGSYGVDLNRNYGYKWGYDNSGSSRNTLIGYVSWAISVLGARNPSSPGFCHSLCIQRLVSRCIPTPDVTLTPGVTSIPLLGTSIMRNLPATSPGRTGICTVPSCRCWHIHFQRDDAGLFPSRS